LITIAIFLGAVIAVMFVFWFFSRADSSSIKARTATNETGFRRVGWTLWSDETSLTNDLHRMSSSRSASSPKALEPERQRSG
jgi:hypothetical protein